MRVNGTYDPTRITDQTLSDWNANIPFMPEDLKTIFERGLGRPVAVNVQVGSFSLGADISCPDSDLFAGSIRMSYDKASRNNDSDFSIAPDYRGQGLGRGWIQGCIGLSLALKQPVFRFVAGRANGAYSWARMGADMDMSGHLLDDRAYFSNRLLLRLEGLKDHLESRDFGMMRAFARMTNRQDPASLANYAAALPHEAGVGLGDVNGLEAKRMENFAREHAGLPGFGGTFAKDERKHMKDSYDAALKIKPRVKASQCLLGYTAWPAAIDYKDEKKMDQIGAYLGGWRTIQPV